MEQCGLCKCSLTDTTFEDHIESLTHRMTWLSKISQDGPKAYLTPFGDGFECYSEIDKHKKFPFTVYALRCGITSNFLCRVCDISSRDISEWLGHVFGQCHAEKTTAKVTELGDETYRKEFFDVPAECHERMFQKSQRGITLQVCRWYFDKEKEKAYWKKRKKKEEKEKKDSDTATSPTNKKDSAQQNAFPAMGINYPPPHPNYPPPQTFAHMPYGQLPYSQWPPGFPPGHIGPNPMMIPPPPGPWMPTQQVPWGGMKTGFPPYPPPSYAVRPPPSIGLPLSAVEPGPGAWQPPSSGSAPAPAPASAPAPAPANTYAASISMVGKSPEEMKQILAANEAVISNMKAQMQGMMDTIKSGRKKKQQSDLDRESISSSSSFRSSRSRSRSRDRRSSSDSSNRPGRWRRQSGRHRSPSYSPDWSSHGNRNRSTSSSRSRRRRISRSRSRSNRRSSSRHRGRVRKESYSPVRKRSRGRERSRSWTPMHVRGQRRKSRSYSPTRIPPHRRPTEEDTMQAPRAHGFDSSYDHRSRMDHSFSPPRHRQIQEPRTRSSKSDRHKQSISSVQDSRAQIEDNRYHTRYDNIRSQEIRRNDRDDDHRKRRASREWHDSGHQKSVAVEEAVTDSLRTIRRNHSSLKEQHHRSSRSDRDHRKRSGESSSRERTQRKSRSPIPTSDGQSRDIKSRAAKQHSQSTVSAAAVSSKTDNDSLYDSIYDDIEPQVTVDAKAEESEDFWLTMVSDNDEKAAPSPSSKLHLPKERRRSQDKEKTPESISVTRHHRSDGASSREVRKKALNDVNHMDLELPSGAFSNRKIEMVSRPGKKPASSKVSSSQDHQQEFRSRPDSKPTMEAMMKEVNQLHGITYKERMEKVFQLLKSSDPGLIKNLASITPATARELLNASGQLDVLQQAATHKPAVPAAPPAVSDRQPTNSSEPTAENIGVGSQQREKLEKTFMLLKQANPKLVKNLASMTSASAQELLQASEKLAAAQKK